jgi:zeaxanthin epoxidase
MAIEDAHELASSLGASVRKAAEQGRGRKGVAVRKTLMAYQNERILRVGAIHGMAGMAAFMASTYKVGRLSMGAYAAPCCPCLDTSWI